MALRAAEASDSVQGVRPVVLVVDDDHGVRESFRLILEDRYEVLEAADGRQALERLRASPVDLVLLDIRLPEMDGIEVLERIKALDEGIEVILVTAVKTVRTAVAAMKLGAFDYLTKPFEEDELLSLSRRALERRALEREVAFLRSELARAHDLDEIVGRHPAIEKLHGLIAQVARTSTTVLITGESGTGKELVARAIHHQGPRRDGPFVAVNPAAIAETLIESDVFRDEIGTLRSELQVKLLRVLQEREVERVGGTRPVKIDVRFIAATNTNLKEAVARGAFREDLYYRLNVVPVVVPPLRERIQDVPLLVDHFIRRDNRRFHKRVEGLSPEALAALNAYRWPGNVRELENVIERCVVLAEGPVIQLNDLPLDVSLPQQVTKVRAAEALPLNEATDQFEQQIVLRVLERVGWNLTEAGRILEIHRNSLRVKLARWGIRAPGGER